MPTRPTERLALLISGLSSPFLLAVVFSVWPIAVRTGSLDSFLLYASQFVFFSAVVPFIFVLWGVKSGRFTDIHVALRGQRQAPFLVSIGSTALLVLAFLLESAPLALTAMALSLVVNGLLYLVISRSWKISMHASSLAASSVTMAVLVGRSWLWLYLALIPVTWARLSRGRHTLGQALAGATLVTLTTWLVYFAFKLT